MEEKEIVEGCKKNDRNSRKQLYELYSPILYTICLRYTANSSNAKDLMHDCFIKIFAKIGSFKSEGSFEGWMKRIAINTTINWLKKKKAIGLSSDIEEYDIETEALEYTEAQITEEKILEFITELPAGYRTIFNMYAIENYSHKEIAEILNINIGTSLSQYSKAKKILAKKINGYLKE